MQDTTGCINNGVILAKENSDVCNYLIDNFTTGCSYFTPKVLCITTTTGPTIFTSLLKKYKGNEKILLLPYDYFEPCVFGGECNIKDNTYLVHEHNLTWVSENLQILVRQYLYYKKYLTIIVYFVILTLIIYLLYIYDTQSKR